MSEPTQTGGDARPANGLWTAFLLLTFVPLALVWLIAVVLSAYQIRVGLGWIGVWLKGPALGEVFANDLTIVHAAVALALISGGGGLLAVSFATALRGRPVRDLGLGPGRLPVLAIAGVLGLAGV